MSHPEVKFTTFDEVVGDRMPCLGNGDNGNPRKNGRRVDRRRHVATIVSAHDESKTSPNVRAIRVFREFGIFGANL